MLSTPRRVRWETIPHEENEHARGFSALTNPGFLPRVTHWPFVWHFAAPAPKSSMSHRLCERRPSPIPDHHYKHDYKFDLAAFLPKCQLSTIQHTFFPSMLHFLFHTLLFGLFGPSTFALPQAAPDRQPSGTTSEPAPTLTQSEVDGHKYFHEPGGHEPGEDDRLGHYDTRYFHGLVSFDERTETLTHMVKAYLTTFQELGLETWIAHGTLLGWWWNGKVGKQTPLSPVLLLTVERSCLGTGTSIRRFLARRYYTSLTTTIGPSTNMFRKIRNSSANICWMSIHGRDNETLVTERTLSTQDGLI